MTKRILVARYRFIGDTILAIPFLRNLRKACPDAIIDMLVAPVSGEVIENCPYVDNFIYFDTTRKHKYENTSEKPLSFLSYIKYLQKQKYDKCYVLKRSFSSAILCYFANIKERIGFDTEHRGFLLTKKVPYDITKHEIDCFLDVLKADNIEVKDNYLENWIEKDDEVALEFILQQFGITDNPRVIIHATATNKGKLWAKENFAQVIEYLANTKQAQVIYCGTQNDATTYNEIESLIEKPLLIKPLNLCGKLSLKQSLVMIAHSNLLIGNDSGNLHMATSVKTPVIGLYGPMNIKKWHAHGAKNICLNSNLDCSPCGLKKKCTINYECLSKITVEEVKAAINKLLQ